MNKTIVIVVGEASGDVLGAGLMSAMRKHDPDLQFEGIGGPKMIAQGFNSIVPMERLSVMGLVEVLGRLPELLSIRRKLLREYTANPPAVFVGIDAPDFNLGLETKLKQQGIPTVHYVSPTVWAWRPERVLKVQNACHRVLSIFPFEAPYYARYQIPLTYVGHRLADQIPGVWTTDHARETLGIDKDAMVLTVLPGSREREVKALAPVFLSAAKRLQAMVPNLQVFIAAASTERQQYLQKLVTQDLELVNTHVVSNQTHPALAAADAVMVASGTASLETMLFQKPMLVCYKLSNISYRLLKRKLTIPYISLPNILAGEAVVQELLQEQVTVSNIVKALQTLLTDTTQQSMQRKVFYALHEQLACHADDKAATAVFDVMVQCQASEH